MKLNATATFPAPVQTVLETFLTPEFDRRLEAATKVRYEVLSEHREGTVEVRRLKFISGTELPGLVAKALGSSTLSYEQVNRLDRASGRLEWEVHVPVLGSTLHCRGVTTCVAQPGGGTARVLDGEINVRIPLVGGKVEELVGAEFSKSYARANEIALALIREKA